MKNISEINPITAKQITGEFFLKMPKFFFSDPKYRKVTGNASKLYTYLRDRLQYFTMKQEEYEEGEWSRSYLDQDGYLYIICDNTELETVLGFGKDALQAAKKNLEKFGLLRQVRVKDKPNKLYIGAPDDIQENWDYKKEIRENQAAAKEKRAEEYKAKLEKEEAQTKEEETPQSPAVIGRADNPIYGRADNPKHVDRKTRPSLITNKSLELKELKELINISFSLEDIAAMEKELKDKYPIAPFEKIKINVLNDPTATIHKESNYFGLLEARLKNHKTIKRSKEFTRQELVPAWFNERTEAPQEQQSPNVDIDAAREKLKAELAAMNQGQA